MIDESVPGFQEWHQSGAGRVPRIGTELGLSDRIGACKARWGIGRMSYLVPPGLYAVGTPTADDPVLVTANYKMSYDAVRRHLAGCNVWLLVLETFGINVWCAAGKGTFGTDELVRRIQLTNLPTVVRHRRLILPILGAPGVAAHEVTKRTGFAISYGPLRADDLPEFLGNGMVTTSEMRHLTFTLRERLVLIPVEFVGALKPTAIIAAVLAALFAIFGGVPAALAAVAAYLGAMLAGVAATPILLPWLPGRSFSIKGALIGLVWAAGFCSLIGTEPMGPAMVVAGLVGLPAVTSFHALNFTGSTPFTSRSGVKKEMRLALPVMACAVIASLLLVAAGMFVQGRWL